jgi:hypothetical protein
MKNILLSAIFVISFGLTASTAQNIYFNFNDGTYAAYALSNVRSITYSDDIMNLNKTDGTTDSWSVTQISNFNYNGFTGVQEEDNELAGVLIFPNPSTSTTTVEYQINKPGSVVIELRDLTGKLIKILQKEHTTSGTYTTVLDATENYLQAGSYFCRISLGKQTISKQLIITN